jgi:hypothetical protein
VNRLVLSRSLNIEKMVLSGREEFNSPAGKDCELFRINGVLECWQKQKP